jgi:DNA invertase Pin-like site-specific DNA recombinase
MNKQTSKQMAKRAANYLRVSSQDQHTSNQEAELRQAADRADWEVEVRPRGAPSP